MMEKYIDKFNYLLHSGYDEDMLNWYFYVKEDIIKDVVDSIYSNVIKGIKKDDVAKCLIVGGQPGSGKSCYSYEYVKNHRNYVYVNLDNYRIYHPYFSEIRNMILDKWGDDNGSSEDNPSNDLTNITHYFAVMVNDILVDMLSKKGYNILLEWNLRYSKGPLEFIEKLNNMGYVIDIVVIITSRNISYDACKLRYDVLKDKDRLVRRVPKGFHDLCVDNLASSVSEIEKIGYVDKNIINNIKCILRNGNIIWRDGMGDICDVINYYLNNDVNGLYNDISYIKKMYQLESNKNS